jgi:hypothetical protein
MSETVILPAPVLDLNLPPRTKWERECRAFKRLLPELLQSHRGQYVAIHEERVVDCGDDPLAVALRVLSRVGNVDIHVGLVSEQPERVDRSGIVREIR